ncbi:Sgta [Symbiodinium microadriaticum]|nr:Sgta [Symbiodinium microadriaticum]
MWRPRFAPPYNPDDDPWQHGIFGDPNPEPQRPTSSHQQPQQGTGPLVDVSAAAASAGGGQASPTAVDSDEDMPLAPPETDPPPGATAEPGLQQQGTPYPTGDTDDQRQRAPHLQTNPSSSSSEPTQVLNITMSAGIPPNRTGETYIQNRLSRNRQHQQQEQGNPATSAALPRSGVKAPPQAPGRLSPARYKAPPTQALASTAAAEPPVKQLPAQPDKPVAQGLQKPPGDHQTRKAPQPKPPPAHLVHEETPQPRRPAAAAGSQPQDQPQEEPPKPRQPPPADFRHSQPTALYRQVFGHGRDPPATPAGSTAIAGHPVQEDDLEHEEPPETAAAAAAAAESPSQTTDDVWEKLRASLQHLDADPIVGTRQEPEPSFVPGQQHGSQPPHQQQEPHAEEAPHQPQIRPPSAEEPQRQLAGREVPAPKDEGLRKRRPWQQPPRQIPQGQHNFHDRADPPGGDQPAQEAEPSQPAAEGPHHEAQADAPQHLHQHQQQQQEQETAETAATTEETRASPQQDTQDYGYTAAGEAPQNHQQPPARGTTPHTTHPETQPEPGTQTDRQGHSSAPSRDQRSNQQQRQERQHPASSSNETGTPHSAAQQWGRYTPGSGDQRTRNKADKTWIHAEFAKRGWRKPEHLTWRQVEHWLHSPEQKRRGEPEQQRQTPTRTHQPGLFTQLLNLHLQPRGPGSVLPHQRPTGSTRVAATSSARAHRRNTEAVHVPPNYAQVTWLDNGTPPTFPPSLPLQACSQMLCLYRGSGRWDLRILSTSPDAEPFLAQGIYPQVLYAPGPTRHEQWFPVGAGLVATPLGDVSLASRQRWGLTSSLLPAAWLIQVDQTRRRAHGEPDIPGEVELHRGDSFLIIWEEDGWTLFERYPGDVAAWTATVMPEGTEVSHHNHILLPSQQVYDGENPQAPEPNASSSQARGHRSGDSTPHKAAPPRPPSSSTSSGNRSERAWASEEGGEQRGEHDRTELMQRTSPHPRGESTPSEPNRRTAAAAPHSGASEEPEHMTSNSSHRKRGQPTPGQQPPQHAPAIEHPLFGAPSTQTQEEMLAVAQLVEEGQASRVAWTGGRNPCQDAHEATVPETTPPTQQQRGHSPGSPTRKRSKTGASQQQPEPEPGDAAASNAQAPAPPQHTTNGTGLLQFFQEAALLVPGSGTQRAPLTSEVPVAEDKPSEGGEPDVQAAATELKVKGNEHFKKSEYSEALDVYTRAAETYMYDASIWLNRSICNRKLNNLEDAATDAEIAQEIDPSNVKAYYNRALALQLLDKHDEALSICKKGLNTQSGNKALQQLKIDLQKSIAEAKAACPGELAPCPQGPVKAADALQKKDAPKSSDDVYEWKNGEPSEAERQGYKKAMVDMFRSKYEELKERAEAAKSKRSTLQTDHYEDAQKQSLQLSGGHRPMDRPDNVDLPADYQQPVGLLSAEQLSAYDAENANRRYLLSVYGNIFDVSDRPDKYDPDGPYASLTGKDLTWGLFAGVDTVEYTNKFYDLYKARDLGKDKLAGVCSWLAWYESEYGKPVGQLEPWSREAELPAPPLEEIEEMCVVM